MPYTAPYQWRNPYPAPCHIDIPPFDLYNDDSLRAEIRLIQRWLFTRGVYLSEYGNENAANAFPEVPVDTFMQRLDADQVSFDLIIEVRGAIPLIGLLREFGRASDFFITHVTKSTPRLNNRTYTALLDGIMPPHRLRVSRDRLRV